MKKQTPSALLGDPSQWFEPYRSWEILAKYPQIYQSSWKIKSVNLIFNSDVSERF